MSTSSTEAPTGQEPGGAAGAAGATGQEPGGTTTQRAGQEPGAGQGQQADAFDASTITDPAVRAYVERQQADATAARQEAAQHRVALRTATETAAEAATRQAQEAETARQAETARLSALEKENRDLRVGNAITTAASTAHDPAIVASIIGPNVTLDDKGQPTNVVELVTALKGTHPYLFKVAGRTDAGAGAGGGGQAVTEPGDMNAHLRQMAKRGTRSV